MLPQSESYTCQHGSEQEIQEVSLLKIPWLFPEKNKNSLHKKLQDITTSSGFWPQLTTIRFPRSFFFSTNFPSSSRKNIVEITVILNHCFFTQKIDKAITCSVCFNLVKQMRNKFIFVLVVDWYEFSTNRFTELLSLLPGPSLWKQLDKLGTKSIPVVR